MTARVVLVRTGDQPSDTYPYGPFDDEKTAEWFAQFLTAEVDPARVYQLNSPVLELLSWRAVEKGDPARADA